MTADLAPFTFDSQQVRVVVIDGSPWFVAADVCAALGYANGRDAIGKHVPAGHRGVSRIATPSAEQNMTVISESGLYRLIMRSNAPSADAFQEWVTGTVLPSIRRTGSYSVAPARELSRLELIELALAAEKAHLAAQERIAELEPVAAFAQAAIEADGRDFSLREAAQILDRDPAIKTGQNRLYAFLRDGAGWIDRSGRPYQRHVECGRIVAKVQTYKHPHTGEVTVARPQLRITVKGLSELHRLLGGVGDGAPAIAERAS